MVNGKVERGGIHKECNAFAEGFALSAVIVFVIVVIASGVGYAYKGLGKELSEVFYYGVFVLMDSLMASFAYRTLVAYKGGYGMKERQGRLLGAVTSIVVVAGTFAKFSIIPVFDVTPGAESMRLELSLFMFSGTIFMYGLLSRWSVIMTSSKRPSRKYIGK